MLKRSWSKWAYLLLGGATLLAAPTCAQVTSEVANLAEIVTAGGVIYLVTRVLE